MGFFDKIIDDLEKKKKEGKIATIVLPEGGDKRVVEAAIKLKKSGLIEPLVLGDEKEVGNVAKDIGLDLGDLKIIDPKTSPDKEELTVKLMQRRKGRLEREEAEEIILNPNYFGTMLIFTDRADGMVSGAASSTADTVRPALQIIKTKPGITTVSGLFIMERDEEIYFFADCAINILPTAEELATIAKSSYDTVKKWGYDSKVAMLSFSTKGSGRHELADKVIEATRLALENNPDLPLDGELQFDAAFVPSVGEKKAPGSKVAGHANTFIFPALEAGNIGYKIAQRLGGFKAVGPVLQGLNQPVNDLSRGCNVQDIYDLSLVTASQALSE